MSTTINHRCRDEQYLYIKKIQSVENEGVKTHLTMSVTKPDEG